MKEKLEEIEEVVNEIEVDIIKLQNLFSNYLKQHLKGLIIENYIGEYPTFMEPVILGEKVKIGDDVLIGPYVYIGENSEIGNYAELSNTIIFDNVRVGDNIKLDNCIIAKDCKLNF
ncbi:MAG: NDP-sugar synthase, partial [Candidatus Lokiarchaeota archaeon]|nr:NDP-sugar synthase [Candidatus Lokiarchaeota archaeon]